MANILLTDNDTNIADPDQVEIMKEAVDYFTHPKSGIRGFTEMKDGWKNITERVNKGEVIKKGDKDAIEAVESWIQEERDMALILSRELGTLVGSGNIKFKDNLKGRIDNEVNTLIETHNLESLFRISGAASIIYVRAKFMRRTIEFVTALTAPQDKPTIRGQAGWIKKQVQKMQSKSPQIYELYKNDLMISIKLKNMSGEERIKIDDLDSFIANNKDRYIREYGIILSCDMGRNFGSKTNSIKKIEKLLVEYYQGVVQHLVKWQKPAPEIKNRDFERVEAPLN